jgi:hypothetical protein
VVFASILSDQLVENHPRLGAVALSKNLSSCLKLTSRLNVSPPFFERRPPTGRLKVWLDNRFRRVGAARGRTVGRELAQPLHHARPLSQYANAGVGVEQMGHRPLNSEILDGRRLSLFNLVP